MQFSECGLGPLALELEGHLAPNQLPCPQAGVSEPLGGTAHNADCLSLPELCSPVQKLGAEVRWSPVGWVFRKRLFFLWIGKLSWFIHFQRFSSPSSSLQQLFPEWWRCRITILHPVLSVFQDIISNMKRKDKTQCAYVTYQDVDTWWLAIWIRRPWQSKKSLCLNPMV